MKHLEQELQRLQRDILRMATTVEEAIINSIRALRLRDTDLSRAVIEGDVDVDEQSNAVEAECHNLLALYQPVARDLRRIMAVAMINTDLERMADLAVNIAERAEALADLPKVPVPDRLQQMTDLTIELVHQSLDAFVTLDSAQARAVCRRDEEVDRLNREIIDELVAVMKKSPDLIEPGLSLFSAVRHLERIADHATNIAEDVVFLVEGELIRHHPEAIEAP
jgi:phosphate transport system protein